MKDNDPKYESLKAKLRKLQALAEKGCYGEAQAARHAIETLCAKYGISMEDVLDFGKKRVYTFEIGRGKDMMHLFIRCLDNVCCTDGMKYSKPTRSSIRIELTALAYAEVSALFDWHKQNFERELKQIREDFMSAYIGKHNLLFDTERSETASGDKLTEEDITRIRRVWKLREAMSDNSYHKMIEAQ